jgi:hypothetical protein
MLDVPLRAPGRQRLDGLMKPVLLLVGRSGGQSGGQRTDMRLVKRYLELLCVPWVEWDALLNDPIRPDPADYSGAIINRLRTDSGYLEASIADYVEFLDGSSGIPVAVLNADYAVNATGITTGMSAVATDGAGITNIPVKAYRADGTDCGLMGVREQYYYTYDGEADVQVMLEPLAGHVTMWAFNGGTAPVIYAAYASYTWYAGLAAFLGELWRRNPVELPSILAAVCADDIQWIEAGRAPTVAAAELVRDWADANDTYILATVDVGTRNTNPWTTFAAAYPLLAEFYLDNQGPDKAWLVLNGHSHNAERGYFHHQLLAAPFWTVENEYIPEIADKIAYYMDNLDQLDTLGFDVRVDNYGVVLTPMAYLTQRGLDAMAQLGIRYVRGNGYYLAGPACGTVGARVGGEARRIYVAGANFVLGTRTPLGVYVWYTDLNHTAFTKILQGCTMIMSHGEEYDTLENAAAFIHNMQIAVVSYIGLCSPCITLVPRGQRMAGTDRHPMCYPTLGTDYHPLTVYTDGVEAVIALTYSGTRPTKMRWREGLGAWSAWETFAETITVDVSAGDGDKEFWVQFRNGAEIGAPQPATVNLDTTDPTGTIAIADEVTRVAVPEIAVDLTINSKAGAYYRTCYIKDSGTPSAWSDWASCEDWVGETPGAEVLVALTDGLGDYEVVAQYRDQFDRLSEEYTSDSVAYVEVATWTAVFDDADTSSALGGESAWTDPEHAKAAESPDEVASIEGVGGEVTSDMLRLIVNSPDLPPGKEIASVEAVFSIAADMGRNLQFWLYLSVGEVGVGSEANLLQAVLATPSEIGKLHADGWLVGESTDLLQGVTIEMGLQIEAAWGDAGAYSVGHGRLEVKYFE